MLLPLRTFFELYRHAKNRLNEKYLLYVQRRVPRTGTGQIAPRMLSTLFFFPSYRVLVLPMPHAISGNQLNLLKRHYAGRDCYRRSLTSSNVRFFVIQC